jgi:hypothetical protein
MILTSRSNRYPLYKPMDSTMKDRLVSRNRPEALTGRGLGTVSIQQKIGLAFIRFCLYIIISYFLNNKELGFLLRIKDDKISVVSP